MYDESIGTSKRKMDDGPQTQIKALRDAVQAAALSDACKRTVAWCLGKLPALYAEFCQTRESRYGDEITRLAQAAVMGLVSTPEISPEAQQLAAKVTKTLQRLHEKFGLPALQLKSIGASPTRSRKVG